MSRPYGPVLLTPAVASFVDIDASASWAIVENSSLNLDLGVSFQVNRPPVVATFSGSPYVGVIQAGAAKRFTLPIADGTWTGRIWMLPLSVATQSGQTGSGSTYSRAYVTSYTEHEEPTDAPNGVIRGLDLTSQPRIVSLPMTNQVRGPNTVVLPGAVQVAPLATQRLLTRDSITGLTGFNAYGFIYAIEAQAVTVGICTVALGFMTLTPALALSNFTSPFAHFTLSRAGQFGPSSEVFTSYSTPISQFLGVFGATDDSLAVYYYLESGGAGMTVDLMVNWSLLTGVAQGATSVVPPLPYGQFVVTPRTLY